MVEGPSLEGVVQLTGAVGREDDGRRPFGRDGADLGDRDLEVGEDLEQEGLELVVGPVDLVDEQHAFLTGLDGPEKGSLDEEAGTEQVLEGLLGSGLLLGQRTRVEDLAGVVPLVEGLVGVDALVALEADQLDVEDRRQHLGDLRLARPRLALEQQRATQ